MSAQVTKESGKRPFIAWCEPCGDGVRHGTAARAQWWADQHNAARHPGEPDPA